jgi:hypothetical protein
MVPTGHILTSVNHHPPNHHQNPASVPSRSQSVRSLPPEGRPGGHSFQNGDSRDSHEEELSSFLMSTPAEQTQPLKAHCNHPTVVLDSDCGDGWDVSSKHVESELKHCSPRCANEPVTCAIRCTITGCPDEDSETPNCSGNGQLPIGRWSPTLASGSADRQVTESPTLAGGSADRQVTENVLHKEGEVGSADPRDKVHF